MKLINLLIGLFLVSCSSIPKGSGVMKAEVSKDQKRVPRLSKGLAEIKTGNKVQVVRSYAQVLKDNVLNYESVFYVPLPAEKINWKQEVRVTPEKKFEKIDNFNERDYTEGAR